MDSSYMDFQAHYGKIKKKLKSVLRLQAIVISISVHTDRQA